MKDDVIIYGSGYIAQKTYPKICEKYTPVCFAEYDLQGSDECFSGLPVMPFDEAIVKYPACNILIAVPHFFKYDVINKMLSNNISVNKIIGAEEPVAKRWGCVYLEQYASFWNTEMRHCCSLANTYHLPFKTAYAQSPEENINSFIADTEKFIESMQDDGFRAKYCKTCRLLRHGYWAKHNKFYKIGIMPESPCNFRCVYCTDNGGVYQGRSLDDGGAVIHGLQFIKCCQQTGKIDDFANIWLSPGEPSIHPLIGDIIDAVKDYRCTIATNASVYSEPIAELLKLGMSQIRVSIDAGTSETFADVRGVKKKICLNV